MCVVGKVQFQLERVNQACSEHFNHGQLLEFCPAAQTAGRVANCLAVLPDVPDTTL